jgi:hypothetical protein
LIAFPPSIPADAENRSEELYEVLTVNSLSGLGNGNISLGDWVTFGYRYNPAQLQDYSHCPGRFNNLANEFDLHQLGLFITNAAIGNDTD